MSEGCFRFIGTLFFAAVIRTVRDERNRFIDDLYLRREIFDQRGLRIHRDGMSRPHCVAGFAAR